MNGILIIDKPEGMTSHDVVQAIRKKLKTSKVGHLGTLDPMATGVLPVSVGKATRVAQFITGSPKEYDGELRFGFATNTYDREGIPVTQERPLRSDEGIITEAIRSLTGILEQIPPPFSAKKIGGVPSHQLARRNQAVELAPSRVEVERFEIIRLIPPLMQFRVICSPGTYIRSLAHDLGRMLECGAHLTALRRTRSGDFHIQDAVPLDRANPSDILPLDRLLPGIPRVEVSGPDETKVRHGNPVYVLGGAAPLVRIFNKKGEFIAVASVENGLARPRLVLTSVTSDESDMLGCILQKEIES